MQKLVRRPETVKKNHYSAIGKYQSSKVAASYDERRFGGWFGRLKHWNTEQVLARAFSMVGPDATVLDLACGTGRFIPLLERKTHRWLGADISLEMLEVSRAKVMNAQRCRGFVRSDAERLPFKSDSVACVMAIRFIHHIPCPHRQHMLREFRRVTKDWLVIEWKVSNPLNAFIRHAVRRRVKPISGPEEVRKELHEAGFRVAAMLPVSCVFSNAVIFIARKQ